MFVNETVNPMKSFFPWPWRSILVFMICGSITILTILGNGLILVSVKWRFHLRSYSDYFIISLCSADFFVGLFVMPLMTIHSIHLRWPFHFRFCYVWMSIDFTCSTASFLTLASMALDRYYVLTTPYLNLRNRSQTSVLICIVAAWLIPFSVWPSSIFLADYFNLHPAGCFHPARPIIIVILCLFFYCIPILFMLICYSRIILHIRNIENLVNIRANWENLQHRQENNSSMDNIFLKFFTRNRSSAAPSANSFSPLLIQRRSRRTRSTMEHHSNVENEFKFRTRLNARTPSPAGNPCVSYSKKRCLQLNSFLVDEQCRDIHSSHQGLANGGLIPSDISDRSSSVENTLGNDERRRCRYSQRAVAQFMHQRNKARLRRNQKASRTLGILLIVFLICWLPFTISYPLMVFYPNRFSSELESVIFWMGYVNSLLNPFLYVYSSRNFRQAIVETLCRSVRLRSREQLRFRWSTHH